MRAPDSGPVVEHEVSLRVQTMGGFRVWRDGVEVEPAAWRREKAIYLFQFLVTVRGRYLHKEQIIDRLWPEMDVEAGDRDFRVALNAVHRALEPQRPPRAEPRFVQRHDLAYGLDVESVRVDADAFEAQVITANQALPHAEETAIERYQAALDLYRGDYLPERRYEDWSSAERERLQMIALTTMTTLARLLVERNPPESIRLAQRVLATDPVWEDAYRVQMAAYMAQGNRPLTLRTYHQCVEVLEREFGVEPLPETQALYERTQAK
ncbi:MAG: transcriptional regulator [Anaerolineae bacterium]|nr:transcriptional regulator [Anaerolineae bacterium]